MLNRCPFLICLTLIVISKFHISAMQPPRLMSQRSRENLQTITANIQQAPDAIQAMSVFKNALLSPISSHKDMMYSPVVQRALIKKLVEHWQQIDHDTAHFIKVMPGAKEWAEKFLPSDESAVQLISKALLQSASDSTHDCDQLAFLLELLPRVNMKDEFGNTLCMRAVYSNNYELVKFLLDKGADPCIPNSNGVTTLMIAAQHNNTAIMKLLIDYGVPIDAQNSLGATALMYAVHYECRAAVTFLLMARVNTLLYNNQNQTALDIAIQKEFLELERLLNSYNKNKQCTIIKQPSNFKSTSTLSVLERLPDSIFECILNHSLKQADSIIDVLRLLRRLALSSPCLRTRILNSATINEPIIRHLAAICFKNNTVKAAATLDTRGAQKWLKKEFKKDPYLAEIAFSYFNELMRSYDSKKMRFLIDAHMNVDTQDLLGNTLLIYAAKNNNLPAARLLLFAHASVDMQNGFGDTALMYAVSNNNVELVKRLLAARANPSIKNRDEENTLIWAIMHSHNNLIEILVKAGVDLQARTRQGSTALFKALELGNKSAVRLLLVNGASETLDRSRNSIVLSSHLSKRPSLLSLLQEYTNEPISYQ